MSHNATKHGELMTIRCGGATWQHGTCPARRGTRVYFRRIGAIYGPPFPLLANRRYIGYSKKLLGLFQHGPGESKGAHAMDCAESNETRLSFAMCPAWCRRMKKKKKKEGRILASDVSLGWAHSDLSCELCAHAPFYIPEFFENALVCPILFSRWIKLSRNICV